MTEFALLRVVAVLALVLLMIVACGWLAKRTGLASHSGQGVPMRLLGRLSLGGRSSIVVLEVQGQRLVVGVSPTAIQTLHHLPDATDGTQEGAPAGQPVPSSPSFAKTLQGFWPIQKAKSGASE